LLTEYPFRYRLCTIVLLNFSLTCRNPKYRETL